MSVSKQLTLIPQFLLQVPVCITELWWFEWEQSPQSLVLHMVHSGWWNFWKFRWFSLAEVCHLQFSLFSLCMLLKDMISQLPVPSCSFLCLLFIAMFFPALVNAYPSGTMKQSTHSLPEAGFTTFFHIDRKGTQKSPDVLQWWTCELNV